MIKVSLIMSSVRWELYKEFFDSLKDTSVEYEVISAGHRIPPVEVSSRIVCNWKYIPTKRIKPSQCYDACRREARGETIMWVADDCEFKNDVVGKAYKYWKSQEDEKLILSIQTKENGVLLNMRDHSFFWGKRYTPLMAPLGMMSQEYLDQLGGIDARYTAGQYENDIVLRVYEDGGSVDIFGDSITYIDIEHLKKHGRTTKFWDGYKDDRIILEGSWINDGNVSKKRLDAFVPFVDEDLLTKSQHKKGDWV